MLGIINQMNQLQEMILTRDEHRQTGDGSHLGRLNESIDAMIEKLPEEARQHFQRLYNKDHSVMAPMYNGNCSICGMKLPISQVQAVRACKALQTCPNCARILFEETDAPQWIGESSSRVAPRKTGISRFSNPSLMISALAASDRAGAIRELCTLMEEKKFVSNSEKLIQSALEREAVLSTAMGEGLAFPHVRGVEGGGLALAVGVSREGIEWDEGVKVNIVFMITIPTAVSAFYLRLMSGLTGTFAKEANRAALMAATTPEELWKALTKATRYTIK